MRVAWDGSGAMELMESVWFGLCFATECSRVRGRKKSRMS